MVNRDLYNHIFTRKGSRVKMPTFGTSIPDMLFEQLDDDLMLILDTELREVIAYDPRVKLLSLNLYPIYDLGTVYAVADLQYIELDLNGKLDIKLEFEG